MEKESGFQQVRKIDNSHRWLPLTTTAFMIALLIILVWFFKGGSFRLYASVFFSYYNLTGQIWLSVILIGITQNIVFLPLRFVKMALEDKLKQFEDILEKTKDDNQSFLFSKKVKEGDISVIFFILDFLVNAIAFFSAGRIFLIDFYTKQLNPRFLYSFVKYPDYPLKGTIFNLPYPRVDQSMALDWSIILKTILIFLTIVIIPRLIWRLVRFIFTKNKKILAARIKYNKIILFFSGFAGTLFLITLYILRHIPTKLSFPIASFDLTHPNRPLNIITAIATFLTTLHAGVKRNNLAVSVAKKAKIPQDIIKRVTRQNLRNSFKNGLILGIGAYIITNQIPAAFELSVATFEVIYIISPYSFDLILKSAQVKAKANLPKN